MDALLKAEGLCKTFGTLPVIQQVGFELGPGEVLGLTGSVGSGKSVLTMLLAGMYVPDAGRLEFAGHRLRWPFSARELGIGVIHQEPTLDDKLDIVSNIFLGSERGWPAGLGPLKILDQRRMYAEAGLILTRLGLDPGLRSEKTANLSGELRQMIAIARVLTFAARLVIVDEPTVLLGYANQQRLLGLMQDWRRQGVAVLFSSNNLDQLFAVTDRILILHQGTRVADLKTDETNREAVVSLLLGNTDPAQSAPARWDFDSYGRLREQSEKRRYFQMLMGRDLAAEPTLSRQLTEELAEQVQALDQTNLALLEAQRRLLSEREQERKHVARELHDTIIQDLLSINYELEGMETEEGVAPGLANDLGDVRLGIRELVDNLRRICGELRPPTIDSLGLGAALTSLTREWSARTGIQAELSLDEALGRLPESSELSLFRIAQEALNNVRRHAQASQVQITLQHTSPRMLMLSIRDNGVGVPENMAREMDIATLAAGGHYGLIGIGERVALLGGRFRLQRLPEGGTLLLVEIPHARLDDAADEAI